MTDDDPFLKPYRRPRLPDPRTDGYAILAMILLFIALVYFGDQVGMWDGLLERLLTKP